MLPESAGCTPGCVSTSPLTWALSKTTTPAKPPRIFALKCQAEESSPDLSLPVQKWRFSSPTAPTSQNQPSLPSWMGLLQLRAAGRGRAETLQQKQQNPAHQQLYFTHKLLFLKKTLLNIWRKTPDCALQISSQQSSLISPQSEVQAWERRTAEMGSLLLLLLCGSYGKPKPGQMISLC